MLDSGERLDEAAAHFLAPVEPTKIIAVHLTYRSRVEEYARAQPPEPSYFMKPPTTLNGHRGAAPPAARRALPQLRGRGGGRRSASACTACPRRDVLDYVDGFARANDVGLHDFRHADRGSMLRVKGQDGFLPIGPALVPADECDPDRRYDAHART